MKKKAFKEDGTIAKFDMDQLSIDDAIAEIDGLIDQINSIETITEKQLFSHLGKALAQKASQK